MVQNALNRLAYLRWSQSHTDMTLAHPVRKRERATARKYLTEEQIQYLSTHQVSQKQRTFQPPLTPIFSAADEEHVTGHVNPTTEPACAADQATQADL